MTGSAATRAVRTGPRATIAARELLEFDNISPEHDVEGTAVKGVLDKHAG